jgi:8-oxo-dGTP pyrophosphatase MutT (NUDIX family)
MQFHNITKQLDMTKTYFLCVQYKKTGDIQVFITGTLKQGESPVQCAFRELEEEAQICVSKMKRYGKTTRNRGQPITLYCAPLKGATLAPGVANAQKNPPDIRHKVAVIAYGTEADIRAIYANSSEAQKYGDKINSVVYIQGSVLCEIMKRLEFDPPNRDTSFLYRQ